MLFGFAFKQGRLHCISLSLKSPFALEIDVKFENWLKSVYLGQRNIRDWTLRQLIGPKDEKKACKELLMLFFPCMTLAQPDKTASNQPAFRAFTLSELNVCAVYMQACAK